MTSLEVAKAEGTETEDKRRPQKLCNKDNVWLTLYEKCSPDTGMMTDEAKAVHSGIQ